MEHEGFKYFSKIMTHQKQTDTHMHGHFWLSRKKLPKTRFRYEIRAHRTRIVRIIIRIKLELELKKTRIKN